MKTKKKLEFIQTEIEKIISKAENLETEYADSLSAVQPVYRESALNLLHYLAFRSFDIGELQQRLRYLGLPDLELARLCQQAEQEFAGTQCGLMDQLISVAGQEGHALLIDCRSFTWQAVPLPPEQLVVVCDTGRRRGLADSAYNRRRAQCEEAAQRLGVPALRDLGTEAFEARAGELPPLLRKRARHVVYENRHQHKTQRKTASQKYQTVVWK